jgi:hypothetical protein
MKRVFFTILISINIFLNPTLIKSEIKTPTLEDLKNLVKDYMDSNSDLTKEIKENFLSQFQGTKKQEKKFTETDGCWLKAVGRGVGKPIHSCSHNLEQSGLLCYPYCKENYTGVGPVCWQNCQGNYRDDGAFCFKSPAYGRGAGYTTEEKCVAENLNGCEKNGLLHYPKCQAGYKSFGCCICTPVCQDGMTDIGISCAKDSYGRGAGDVLGCDDSQDYDAGLCYGKCQNNFKGIGPVCWGSCPAGFNQCGALCLNGKTCSDQMRQYFQGVIDIITAFAAKNYPEGIIDIGKFVKDLIYPIC